jgi:hypothetical protein
VGRPRSSSSGALRQLVDPTFDPPGEYHLGGGRTLTRTAADRAALTATGLADRLVEAAPGVRAAVAPSAGSPQR